MHDRITATAALYSGGLLCSNVYIKSDGESVGLTQVHFVSE